MNDGAAEEKNQEVLMFVLIDFAYRCEIDMGSFISGNHLGEHCLSLFTIARSNTKNNLMRYPQGNLMKKEN